MRTLYKILRACLVTLFVCTVVIPAAVYLIMSSEWAQVRLCEIAQRELSSLLGTEVRIGDVHVQASGRLKIHNVQIDDDYGKPALNIGSIETRAEMFDFVTRRKIIIDYATVDSLEVSLYRDSLNAPLNIAGIISRLQSEEKKEQSVFDIRLNNISLTSGSFSYDCLDREETPGKLNPSHIHVTDINTEIFAPRIANNCYRLWLRTFRCREQSGLAINNLTVDADITDNAFSAKGLTLALPVSRLAFNDITVPIDGITSIAGLGTKIPVSISLKEGSHIFLPDLSAIFEAFADIALDFDVDAEAEGTLQNINIARLAICDRRKILDVSLTGNITGLPDVSAAHTDGLEITAHTRTADAISYLPVLKTPAARKLDDIVDMLGVADINATVSGGLNNSKLDLRLATAIGNATIRGTCRGTGYNSERIATSVELDSLNLSTILPDKGLGRLTGRVDIDGTITRGKFNGKAAADIASIEFRGYNYHGIRADITADNDKQLCDLVSTDPNLKLSALISHSVNAAGRNRIEATANIENIRVDTMLLATTLPAGKLASTIDLRYDGASPDDFNARLEVKRTRYRGAEGKELNISSFIIDADNTTDIGHIDVASDFINGNIDGRIRPTRLRDNVLSIITNVFPAIPVKYDAPGAGQTVDAADSNAFTFEFRIDHADDVFSFFNLPYGVVGKGNIKGHVFDELRELYVDIDLPYLQKGTKLIENTVAVVTVNGLTNKVNALFTTNMPTIKGPMSLSTSIQGGKGYLHAAIDWNIRRKQPIAGKINLSTEVDRSEDDKMTLRVNVEPGVIDFGEDVWRIQPSTIRYGKQGITIDNFRILADGQSLLINGTAGTEPTDSLMVSIRDFNMINIFETLGIDNALIGGYATGDILGTALLKPDRKIDCESLKIRDISYNYCVLGDADAKAWFDTAKESFCFDVEVTGRDKRHSRVYGGIVPSTQGLDLSFECDHIPVGFMRPFMSAFSSGVEGTASGKARLYGTFSDIDLDGDIFADSVRLKIDIINVWYNATDSIHIRPGRINLDGITLHDDCGNSASLSGYVGHTCFHNATFDIKVTDADNLLCFNVTRELQPNWYGRIFGNGSASVVGRPGHVDIAANMSTSPHSEFTFELSDLEIASEYSFLTFRDATPVDPLTKLNSETPERVTYLRRLAENHESDTPTSYDMDINVDVNKNATMVLVMDPIGGDQIKATGDGHIRMTYASQSEDLRLYGTYILSQGNYNFSLQDIILKNFTIKQGSQVTFNGDPYSANLNIEAYSSMNANLSDLDESFLSDKELNRTNVPVRALMKVTGDMRQPDLSFDLEFPTLDEDVYRKVRSIISTEEMMNKQIIYLLALNRFFTPEYMSATRGNELFSVASSTITSQLSSMLGKLSDNWSIAPNLRSDKGDFSDVEIDVNLSSSLLNNRLLFNGNFGYRDKSLNTNQFVGDFDVEYLLTRSGMWRLRAYNRYNDQNYYLRTAQTTQGLGLVYKKDFDNLFNFLQINRKKDNDRTNTEIEDNLQILDDDAVSDSTFIEDISIKTTITPIKEKE